MWFRPSPEGECGEIQPTFWGVAVSHKTDKNHWIKELNRVKKKKKKHSRRQMEMDFNRYFWRKSSVMSKIRSYSVHARETMTLATANRLIGVYHLAFTLPQQNIGSNPIHMSTRDMMGMRTERFHPAVLLSRLHSPSAPEKPRGSVYRPFVLMLKNWLNGKSLNYYWGGINFQ